MGELGDKCLCVCVLMEGCEDLYRPGEGLQSLLEEDRARVAAHAYSLS